MKANKKPIKANGLIYPDLSYRLMAVLFKVHNHLGSHFQEKYYQRAVELELKNQSIPYKREMMVKISYQGGDLGRYFIDFVIDNKIALEIKSADYFKRTFIAQVLAYLVASELKLGIIVNFNSNKLLSKRLVNPKIQLA